MKRFNVSKVMMGMSVIALPIFGMTSLLVNKTACLPHRFFVMYPALGYEKGDFVVFEHPVFHQTCVKKLIGTEGDDVTVHHQKVWINGKEIGPVFPHYNKGKIPVKPLPSQKIPKGYVFVAGDHPKSFDSRYEEVGLLPLEKIHGKAMGFWERTKGKKS